jgi:uncharacterized BrkB/YihY/UPF0761 family membrane protein
MNYYWITRLDAINGILLVSIIILAASLLFVIIEIWDNSYKLDWEITHKIFWANLFLLILFILIYLFVPTTEQAHIIWGI